MALAPALLAGLAAMPDELDGVVRQVAASRLRFRPASWEGSPGEPFSVLEHVCHLRDIERDGYQVRIRRLLTEDAPDLVSIDGSALAIERRYADSDVADALAAFREARRALVLSIRDLDDARLARSGTFAEYGALTLRGLLHYLRSHDQQHLACIHWLIGRMASPAAGPRAAQEA